MRRTTRRAAPDVRDEDLGPAGLATFVIRPVKARAGPIRMSTATPIASHLEKQADAATPPAGRGQGRREANLLC